MGPGILLAMRMLDLSSGGLKLAHPLTLLCLGFMFLPGPGPGPLLPLTCCVPLPPLTCSAPPPPRPLRCLHYERVRV